MFLQVETIEPVANQWLQYGVLGSVALIELLALVWIVRKFVAYLEKSAGTIAATGKALERLEATMDEHDRAAEKRHEAVMDEVRSTHQHYQSRGGSR